MADYTGTPLARKLGIKEPMRIALVNAPDGFLDLLGELPDGVEVTRNSRAKLDCALLFVTASSKLETQFAKLAARLRPAGMLWVAWPKKAAKVATDVSFEVVQGTGLAAGLVDNKSCSIDAVWTGLRFVIRLKDRPIKSPILSS